MSANKEGHGTHGSRLQNWVEHELLHLVMQGQQDTLGADVPDRNLSLRVPVTTHLMLNRLAQSLGRSKTAWAEEILNNALRDVYRAFGLPEPTREELAEYLSERAAPEKTS